MLKTWKWESYNYQYIIFSNGTKIFSNANKITINEVKTKCINGNNKTLWHESKLVPNARTISFIMVSTKEKGRYRWEKMRRERASKKCVYKNYNAWKTAPEQHNLILFLWKTTLPVKTKSVKKDGKFLYWPYSKNRPLIVI